MAPEFVTQRDGSGFGDQLPPGLNTQLDYILKAPVDFDGSFLISHSVDMPYVGEPPYTFHKLIDKRPQLRTIRYRRHGDTPGEPALPPLSAWLVDPVRAQFETPVDERGLVRQDELVSHVYSLIDPSFKWPRALSIDHVYYDAEWYHGTTTPDCAGPFRETAVHKMLVRRMWENVKHTVMITPAVPSEEIMQERLEAWDVASNLLRSIRNSERIRYYALERFIEQGGDPSELTDEFAGLDKVTRDWALENLDKHLEATDKHLTRLHMVPREFQLVRPETPRLEMAERLAKIAGAEALHMVKRPAA